jgi:hypothetical protein
MEGTLTLSHCWGMSQIITTKRDTVEDRKKGISIRELPQTFQDVVSIARYLQVQYVWINSLCIIQDDRSDWEREASKMAEIYTNSYLAIAATFSADHSDVGRKEAPVVQAVFVVEEGICREVAAR